MCTSIGVYLKLHLCSNKNQHLAPVVHYYNARSTAELENKLNASPFIRHIWVHHGVYMYVTLAVLLNGFVDFDSFIVPQDSPHTHDITD